MVIRLFRLAMVKGFGNGMILRLAVLFCLLGCFQSQPALACRFNVREVGFVDLRIEPYYFFGYINDETSADVVSKFEQVTDAALENSNIEFEMINTDQQQNHPAMKLLDVQQAKSLPAAVLVSPDGQSYPLAISKSDRSIEETLRSTFENILSSPKREEILKQVIKNYGVVLLIEGTNDEENKKAREAASDAVELISSQMEMMPKSIAHPPVLMVMDQKSLSDEDILLWSLGLEGEEIKEPLAVVLYGRARWIGPLFKGEEIDENNLASVLFVIGNDCECGLDHRWLQGTMLPTRWTDKMQAQVAENLGFDPENPMIKMEMSMIVRRGSYSYPSVPYGYQEIVIEPNSTMEEEQNSPNEFEDIAIPQPDIVEPNIEPSPITKGKSPFRNTIFVLGGLCVLVLASGSAILVRAKRR